MKLSTTVKSLLAIALVAGLGITAALAEDNAQEQAQLAAKAKVSRDEAQKTALDKVPDGTVKEAEIEKEKGKLIWSFGLSRPGTSDTTEVNVDAMTGDLVNVEVETSKDEEKGK